MMKPTSPVVVKLGGSLFDLSDLCHHISAYVNELAAPVLLVPGGGAIVDAIRDLDRRHSFGEETSHWLSLRAMSVNAHMVSNLIAGSEVVQDLAEFDLSWTNGKIAIMDAFAFARGDEGKPGSLPHSWSVTSDSIAARVAVVIGATKLVLLKSVEWQSNADWHAAEEQGVVDSQFKNVITPRISVRVVNFRRWVMERPRP
jgi:aspartokinase-like uncharacterized kinase